MDHKKTLFAMAADYLPIQASSIPCERVFSSSKETTTARRNRMSGKLVEQLQMLKFSLKKGRELSFTQGTRLEDEVKELLAIGQLQDQSPEDIHSFLTQLHQ